MVVKPQADSIAVLFGTAGRETREQHGEAMH